LYGMTGPKDARFEVRLPVNLLAELEKAAKDLRTSRSHITRLAIEYWLATQKERVPLVAGKDGGRPAGVLGG
jgi:metal-responsive CopG/Arc/MetJ family transcriptional regulator